LRDGSSGGVQTPTQAYLFTIPEVKPKEKISAKKRIFAQVKHVTSGVFHYDFLKADSFAKIAQLTSPIMDEAQENNIIVMTDENHRPVVVFKHSQGGNRSGCCSSEGKEIRYRNFR
jgi:hypothetical protein